MKQTVTKMSIATTHIGYRVILKNQIMLDIMMQLHFILAVVNSFTLKIQINICVFLKVKTKRLLFFLELDDMPVGTGTLFVQHAKNPQVLVRESRAHNVTETQESKVIQYMAHGGYKKYSERLNYSQAESPVRILSAIHAGPGQITFGSSRVQKADLTLAFKATETHPAILFVHN